jgi:hypothetical protein
MTIFSPDPLNGDGMEETLLLILSILPKSSTDKEVQFHCGGILRILMDDYESKLDHHLPLRE